MTKSLTLGFALVLLVPGLLFTASCSKKAIKSEPSTTMVEEETPMKTMETDADQARKKAMEEERLREERLRQEAKEMRSRAERTAFENEHIYFEFDKSRLLSEAKSKLKTKARWLLANPRASIIIEGHCDERGTSEYNLALGDRRAQAAKNYLIDLGISSRRITTISYGEERPLVFGHNETAWGKNRRAQFVIQ